MARVLGGRGVPTVPGLRRSCFVTKREMLLLAALWLVVQVLRSVCCVSWDLCTSVTSGRDVAQTGTHTRARSFSLSLSLSVSVDGQAVR
jgi:hypothetical protein